MVGTDLEQGQHLMVTVLDGDPSVVHLAGELDLASLPRVSAALAGCSGDIEVRCSALTFFGVACANALVAAHTACVERGSKLVVVDPSRIVRKVLRLTNVDTVLNIRSGGEPL
jgi:anti-anti-sigma factor